MVYKKELIAATARALHSYGYAVYVAKGGEYGFYTDGAAVVTFGGCWCFSLNFGGRYRTATPADAKYCGTGWGIAREVGVPSEDVARAYIAELPPRWATGGRTVYRTTPGEHLATYGKSSGYALYTGE